MCLDVLVPFKTSLDILSFNQFLIANLSSFIHSYEAVAIVQLTTCPSKLSLLPLALYQIVGKV